MKRLIYMVAVFAALTANSAMAQYNRDQVISRIFESGVYSDERGEYRWQLIEKRVWIPEYQTRGILGIGVRTIPGHYEMRTDRVKVYTNGSGGYNDSNNGRKGNHPHGMPPGQRKKQGRNGNYY